MTTLPKAKDLRPIVEKLVTLGKQRRPARPPPGDRASCATRRRRKLFRPWPRATKARGGYIRVLKAGFRYGDAAPMAVIEFVDRDVAAKGQDSGPSAEQAEAAGGGVSLSPTPNTKRPVERPGVFVFRWGRHWSGAPPSGRLLSTAMDWIFRQALSSEHLDADRVLRAAFTPYMKRLGHENPAHYYKWLPASIERGDVFVADEGGRIVGVAATKQQEIQPVPRPARGRPGETRHRPRQLAAGPARINRALARRSHDVAADRRDDGASAASLRPPRLRDPGKPRPAGPRQGSAHSRHHGEVAVTRRNDR